MSPRVERAIREDGVGGRGATIRRGWWPFAGQLVAVHAGRPVTARVHGAIADGHARHTKHGGGTRPAPLDRAARAVTIAGLCVGGHRFGKAGGPTAPAPRPRQRLPRPVGRHKRLGRRGRAGHRAPVARVVHDGDRSHGSRSVLRRQFLGHVVVPLRRHRLHGLAAAHHVVVVGHQRLRPRTNARPLGKAGSVHGHEAPLFVRPDRRPHIGGWPRRLGYPSLAAQITQRPVRMPAQSTIKLLSINTKYISIHFRNNRKIRKICTNQGRS